MSAAFAPHPAALPPPILLRSCARYLTRAFELEFGEQVPGLFEELSRDGRAARLYQVEKGMVFELLTGENAVGAIYGGAELEGRRWAVLLLPDTFEA